ncbi:MAG TPA: glycosyltransferase family 4 protein [Candidatus Binatia bacterium]|nr:glycosyltransferase family 4 protein [Candidatus Binatia bacterium]
MDKRANKIAHVITNPGSFGGSQRNTLLTIAGLVQDEYEVELVCGPGARLVNETRAVGAPVHVISDLVHPISPLKDCCAFFQLYRLFLSQKYQIVHTHCIKAGLLGRLAARCARVPVVIHTLHGVPYKINGDLKSRFYVIFEWLLGALTHCFVCVGEVLRQEISAWRIAPGEKLTTIHSGIDFSAYVPRRAAPQVKEELEVGAAWPIVGSIGRLSEQKAQHFLIEAVASLKNKYPGIKLLLVGEGPLRHFLERKIRDLDLSAHVSLLGQREDVADLLNIFDVYAMSSQWEGVGRALTEAMYARLPIVTTAVNGVTELVSENDTGLLVPAGDPQALANAIDRVVSDPELGKRLGTNARTRVEEFMDGKRMVRAIEELYERLITSRNLQAQPAHASSRQIEY